MYKKLPQAALILALSMIFLWLSVSYLLPISLPFLLGTGLALLAEPMVRLLSQKCHFQRPVACTIGVSAVFLLSATVLALLTSFFMRQLGRILDFLPHLETAFTHAMEVFRHWLLSIGTRLPDGIHKMLDHWVQEMLSDSSTLLSGMMSRLPQLATGLLGNVSQWLFGLITGIISAYMISIRLPKLQAWVKSKLPQRWQADYLPAVQGLKRTMGGWILAECKLAFVSFCLLLAGFLFLRLEHSFMLAIIITLVDAFPVLGVGTVLIPWSLLRLIQGDRALGLGLLGLYAGIWLIRSVLEPKLLGKGLGLDPLITLLCIYAGFRLWGVGGMLLAPIAAVAITQALQRFQV